MTGGKPKLKKSYRSVFEAAREEAALVGGSVDIDPSGGKHPRVTLTIGDQHWVIPFAGTPRVDYGPSWMRQRIRQKAREAASRVALAARQRLLDAGKWENEEDAQREAEARATLALLPRRSP